MHLPPLEEFLSALQTGALIVLLFRMWKAGLQRVYVYFFSYLLLVLFESAVLALVGYGTVAYGYVWMATEVLSLCFYTLIVLECYDSVLRDLGGIATISRRYIKITLGIAVISALLLLGLERTPRTVFQYFYTLDRTIISSLVMFVLLINIFLVYYPIPLNRNVIVYSVGYAVYFLTKAAALFARNVSDELQRQISAVLIAVSTACLIFWAFTLNRRGESKTVVIGHKWRAGDEERLLSQLKEINASLGRAARK
ncbi:MAG TPA: hypothetical protein VNX70_15435 [Bryobacteraceae bacterium]|nr:hypothetical protein [Bryobacteraceae bacterium]